MIGQGFLKTELLKYVAAGSISPGKELVRHAPSLIQSLGEPGHTPTYAKKAKTGGLA